MVVIGWGDATTSISAVTDSAGNVYKLAIGPTRTSNASQAVYYAANVTASSSNTVQVTFSGTVQSADVRIAEYQGIALTNPLDVAAGAAGGTSANPANTWLTTNNANDLIVAVDLADGGAPIGVSSTSAAAYATRLGTDTGNSLADRIVSAAGPYQVESISADGGGIVQVVAFKLAGGGDSNTQGLSAPGNLVAEPGAAQINLSWTAATDNIGVSGYLVERCDGLNCVNFEQIASVTTTSYSDAGPFADSGSYTYRVRATDVANLSSSYSNTASAAP